MTVLVIETRAGFGIATLACQALSGRLDAVRCAEADVGEFLGSAPARDVDLFVVACDGDTDAGHRVCRRVRSATTKPLVLLTSTRREADELLAFSRGCDDYITTSSSPEIISARLEVLAARGGRRAPEPVVEFGSLIVDPSLRSTAVNGTPLELTRTEFDLLHRFITQQRRVLTRRELLEVGWGDCPPSDHVLDVHLSRLRRKVLQAGGPKIGIPVPGVGYRVGSPDLPEPPATTRSDTRSGTTTRGHLALAEFNGAIVHGQRVCA